MSDFKVLQFHNVHHRVYIDMVDIEKALYYQKQNGNKQTMEHNGKMFNIPVYVEDGAVTVRLHDLPTSMPARDILDYMKQYGTVYSMSWERWKHYFPGTINGVRVLRMRLTKPIPSYLSIKNEQTLCSYESQHKTCKFCNMSIHPKLKCGEASKEASGEPSQIIDSSNFPPINQQNNSKVNQQQAFTQSQGQPQNKRKARKKPALGYISDTNNDESDVTENENNGSDTITGGRKQKRRLAAERNSGLENLDQSSAPAEQSGELDMTVGYD